MCTCASCKVTDRLADAGFAEWPRGKPAGRVSAADYSAHVAYSKQWGRAPSGSVSDGPAIPRFKVGGPAVFPAWMRGNGPIEPAPSCMTGLTLCRAAPRTCYLGQIARQRRIKRLAPGPYRRQNRPRHCRKCGARTLQGRPHL